MSKPCPRHRAGCTGRPWRPDHLEQPVATGTGQGGLQLLIGHRPGHHRRHRQHRHPERRRPTRSTPPTGRSARFAPVPPKRPRHATKRPARRTAPAPTFGAVSGRPRTPTITACNAASSTTGWTPKPAADTPASPAAPPRRTLHRRAATLRSGRGTPGRIRTRARPTAHSRRRRPPRPRRRRPHRQIRAGLHRPRAQRALGVQLPAATRPRRTLRNTDTARAPDSSGAVDHHLHGHRPVGRQDQRRRQLEFVDHSRSRPRRRRGWPAPRTLRPGTSRRHRRRGRPTSPARSATSDRSAPPRPRPAAPRTAPSSACSLAARPRPAASAAAPSSDSQNRRRSKAYVGSSTKFGRAERTRASPRPCPATNPCATALGQGYRFRAVLAQRGHGGDRRIGQRSPRSRPSGRRWVRLRRNGFRRPSARTGCCRRTAPPPAT